MIWLLVIIPNLDPMRKALFFIPQFKELRRIVEPPHAMRPWLREVGV